MPTLPVFINSLKNFALLLKFEKMSPNNFESFPGVHMGHVSVYYNEHMIVLSGYKGYKENAATNYWPSEEIWVYDQIVEKWIKKVCTWETSIDDIPQERTSATATVIDNYLYMFGGFSEDGSLNTLHRLDLTTLKWLQLKPSGPQPLPCDKSASWEYEGKLYLFGGYGRGLNPSEWRPNIRYNFTLDDSSHWHYRRGWNNQFVCYNPKSNSWEWPECNGTVPTTRGAHAVARIGNKVYLFGGRNGRIRMNDMYVLDMVTLEWKQLYANDANDYPVKGRSWHTLTTINDHLLLLFGGFSQDDTPLNDCWIYDINTNVWVEINYSFTKPRFWHSAILSSFGEIYIFGGAIEKISNNVCEGHEKNLDHCAKDMLSIQLKPKSLFRHCLTAVASNETKTRQQWNELPLHLQVILSKRCLSRNP